MPTDSSSVISVMRAHVRVNAKTFYGRLFLGLNKQSDRVRLFYVRLAYTYKLLPDDGHTDVSQQIPGNGRSFDLHMSKKHKNTWHFVLLSQIVFHHKSCF